MMVNPDVDAGPNIPYRLYTLKPRASRSKGASNKLWYA